MTDQELKDLVAQNIISINNLSINIDKLTNDIQELKRTQEKTDEQLRKTDERISKFEKQIEKDHKILLWMWVTQWEISEDIFAENVEQLFEKKWKHIYRTIRNLVIKWKCEYDLIWVNGTEVFVWEIKTRLTQAHIDEFIKKRLETFKTNLPEYSQYKLYWFVWARVLPKWILEYARNHWLYVLKQDSKWMAKIVSSEDLVSY